MDRIEEQQQRLGADAGDAGKIHDQINLLLAALELAVLLGARVDRMLAHHLLAGLQGLGRIGQTGMIGMGLWVQPPIRRHLRRRRCR